MPPGVKIAGSRRGRCHNVMACEGAPSTTSADMGTARRGWRPYCRHDERDGQRRPAPISTPMGRRPAIHDLQCWSQQSRGWRPAPAMDLSGVQVGTGALISEHLMALAGARPMGVKIAGWRHGCCYNVMACEGAPSTTSADIGTARHGWRPCGRHDKGTASRARRPI